MHILVQHRWSNRLKTSEWVYFNPSTVALTHDRGTGPMPESRYGVLH